MPTFDPQQAFDPQQGHRPGYPYGRDIHNGLPENHGLPAGTVIPPAGLDRIHQRGPEPDTVKSEHTEPQPRDWQWFWASIGAFMILYSASAGSRWNATTMNAAERGGYMVFGLTLLIVAVILALRNGSQ